MIQERVFIPFFIGDGTAPDSKLAAASNAALARGDGPVGPEYLKEVARQKAELSGCVAGGLLPPAGGRTRCVLPRR
jgi:hypothetical protein